MAESEYLPRRAEADQEFEGWYQDRAVTLRADGDGVVRPTNAAQQALADAFDLPVARKIVKEERASAPTDEEAG